MANPRADIDVRFKNLEQELARIKRGLAGIQFDPLKFNPKTARDFQVFINTVSSSGPQIRRAATEIDYLSISTSKLANSLRGAAAPLAALARIMGAQRAALRDSVQETKRLSTAAEDLGRQTGITIRRFGGFLIVRDLIFGLGFAFTSAVKNAVEFEREMNKVAQLQNTTAAGVAQLGEQIGKLASDFGASAEKLVKSTQVLAQAGRSATEIRQIISALTPASLTATFGDLEKSTDSINALLGQFKIEAKDTAQVLDILNSVSKEFNVSIDELFEGLRRSGSTFAAFAGVVEDGSKSGIKALKEFSALFTSVIDTSRESADVIGTAFRTILPRLQRPRTQNLLKDLGIDLLTDEKKFVGPAEAIERLSRGLAKLGGAQDPRFTAVVEELGGLRQFNRVLPLITETAKQQRALAIANKAQGSVAKDAALAQETLANALDRVREKFNEVIRDLTRTGTFKVLADSFIVAADAATTLLKSIQPLLPLITALGAAKLFESSFRFGKGLIGDKSFRFSSGIPKFARGGLVALTPGEMVFTPQAANREGVPTLNRFNNSGDTSKLKSFAGASVVPGVGNSDSVMAYLEDGSFVIKKSSVNNALGSINFASIGGIQKFARGGKKRSAPLRGGLNSDVSGNLGVRIEGALLDLRQEKLLEDFARGATALGRDSKVIVQQVKSLLQKGFSESAIRKQASSILRSDPGFQLVGPPRNGGPLVPVGRAGPGVPVNLPAIYQEPGLPVPFRRAGPGVQVNIPATTSTRGGRLPPNRDVILGSQVFSNQTFGEQVAAGIGLNERVGPGNMDVARARVMKRLRGRQVSNDTLFRLIAEEEARFQQSQTSRGAAQSYTVSPRNIRYATGIAPPPSFLTRSIGNIRSSFPTFGAGISKALPALRGLGPLSGQAGFLSLIAGSQIQASSTSAAGKGFGGALSGAGIGTQVGLLAGPFAGIVAPITALIGGIVGATSAIEGFKKELEQTKTNDIIAAFLKAGKKGDVSTVARRLESISTSNRGAKYGFTDFAVYPIGQTRFLSSAFNRIAGASGSQAKAFERSGLLGQLGAIARTAFGNENALVERSNLQISQESAQLRETFAPAAQSILDSIGTQVVKDLSKKRNITEQSVVTSLNDDQLKVLATLNQNFRSGDETDPAAFRALGKQVVSEFARETIDANKSMVDLTQAMQNAAASSISLTETFANIRAAIRLIRVDTENFGIAANDILNRAQLSATVSTRLPTNIFGDISGISQEVLSGEIERIQSTYGLGGNAAFLTTAASALSAGSILNDLPSVLAQASLGQDAGATSVRDFLSDLIQNNTGNPIVQRTLLDSLNAQFTGDNDISLAELRGEEDIQKVVQGLGKSVSEATAIFNDVVEAEREHIAQINNLINQRTQVELANLERRQTIRGLRNQSTDIVRQILGQSPVGIAEQQRRVNQDILGLVGPTRGLSSLTNPGALIGLSDQDPRVLGQRLRRLQDGGITADEATEAGALVKALELLSKDTRVLDATLQKNNELQERQQAATSFVEKILGGGPEAIIETNQALRDFSTIRSGGRLSGQRTLQAIKAAQEIFAAAPEEELQKLFGQTREQFDQRNRELQLAAVQRQVAPGSRDIFDRLIGQAFLGNGRQNLAAQAQKAVGVQINAEDELRKTSDIQAKALGKAIEDQQENFRRSIEQAFSGEKVTNFTNAVDKLAGSKLNIEMKPVDVVVSFNNLNGVLNGIQQDLVPFLDKLVQTQIKQALGQAGIPLANQG